MTVKLCLMKSKLHIKLSGKSCKKTMVPPGKLQESLSMAIHDLLKGGPVLNPILAYLNYFALSFWYGKASLIPKFAHECNFQEVPILVMVCVCVCACVKYLNHVNQPKMQLGKNKKERKRKKTKQKTVVKYFGNKIPTRTVRIITGKIMIRIDSTLG